MLGPDPAESDRGRAVSLQSLDLALDAPDTRKALSGADLAGNGATDGDDVSSFGDVEGEDEHPVLKSSIPMASFNFVNSIIGAGIIGLPFALREAGFLMGLILLLGVSGCTLVSVKMLVAMGMREKKLNYEQLAHHVLGKFGYFSVSIAMFLFAYGAMLAYLIIIGDTVTLVVSNMTGASLDQWVRRLTIFSVAVTCILPLSLIRDMSGLARTSLMSLMAVGWIVFVVVARSFTGVGEARVPVTDEEEHISIVSKNFFPAIGILAFAFVCHHSSFIVYNSLRDNTRRRWEKTTNISIAVSVCACLLLSITGFLTFRNLTQGNLLNNYAMDDNLMNVTRMLFAMTMVFTYPMEIFVARHTMHAVVFYGKGPITAKRHYAISLFLWALSVTITMVVEDLGVVLELSGGSSAVYIGFMLPAVMFIRLSKFSALPWRNGTRSGEAWKELGPAYGLLTVGCIAFVASTGMTLYNVLSGEEEE